MAETDYLKLYKKDPVLNRNDTFNITTMLNDNWDKINAESKRVNELTLNLANDKVDKIVGKDLSTNDFTTILKNKLDGIEAGAERNTVLTVNDKVGDVLISKTDIGLGSVIDAEQTTKTEFENYKLIVDDKLSKVAANDKNAREEIIDIKLKLSEQSIINFLNKTGIGFYDLFNTLDYIDTITTTAIVSNNNVKFTNDKLLKMKNETFENFNNLELNIYDSERITMDAMANSINNKLKVLVTPGSIVPGDRFYYKGEVYTVSSIAEGM